MRGPRRALRPRAPKITETQEHKAVADYLGWALIPPAVAFHVRNERGSAWERIQAAKMGVLPGVPDWIVFNPVQMPTGIFTTVLAIELKPRGWKKRKAKTGNYDDHEKRQLECHQRLFNAGVVVAICETLDEVKAFLMQWYVQLRDTKPSADAIRRGAQNTLAGGADG